MNLQKQQYGIGIFEEEIILSDFTGPAEQRFVISPEQLMGFVRTEVTFRPFPGLIWMKSDGVSDTYLLTLPAGQRAILFRRQQKGKLTTKKLHLPAMAVRAVISIDERKVKSIDIWGFSGSSLKADSILYELPLPNLSGHSLCLGSTNGAVGSDVRSAIIATIFDTPFNHHNYLVGRARLPFPDYVKIHKGRCHLRTLKPIGTGKKILGGRL